MVKLANHSISVFCIYLCFFLCEVLIMCCCFVVRCINYELPLTPIFIASNNMEVVRFMSYSAASQGSIQDDLTSCCSSLYTGGQQIQLDMAGSLLDSKNKSDGFVLTCQDDHVHSPEDAHDPPNHDDSCQYLDEGCSHVEPEHTTKSSLGDQFTASSTQHCEC